MENFSRRGFIGTMGALIAASAVPLNAMAQDVSLPRIALRGRVGVYPTMRSIAEAVVDLMDQVAEIAPNGLTEKQRVAVAANIDEELYNVRPAAVRIDIEIGADQLSSRKFAIMESMNGKNLGIVRIVDYGTVDEDWFSYQVDFSKESAL